MMATRAGAVLVALLTIDLTPAHAMIEPRMDMAKSYRPTSVRQSVGFKFPPVPSPRETVSNELRDIVQPQTLVAPTQPRSTQSILPNYIFSPNVIGPRPPPGYSFSAGPKPARFPQKSFASTERSSTATAESNEITAVSRATQERPGRNRGGTNGKRRSRRPSDFVSCGPMCPKYRVSSRTRRYDVRHYPGTLWASYVTVTENRLLAEMEARAGILEFLSGRNSHSMKLPQTFPFVTQLGYARVPGVRKQEYDFTVSVPLLEGAIHPRPDINQLVVDYVDNQRVFVTSFWARPWKLTDKALRLRAKRFSRRLRRHGHAFLNRYYYLARYDSPESRRRAYYEIWFYSTPFKSRRHRRPTGKPLMSRQTNLTTNTISRLCRSLECPPFEVLAEYDGGVQKRHYYSTLLASSRMDGCDTSIESMWRGLMPLHLYRNGINSHLEVIEATRPIGILRVRSAAVTSQNSSSCSMTSLVYLPERLHRNPPSSVASTPAIGLSYIRNLIVYVRTVGGFVLEPGRVSEEVTAFRGQLHALGLCYRRDEFYVAVYDFIQRYHGRMNEIWLVAQTCPTPNH